MARRQQSTGPNSRAEDDALLREGVGREFLRHLPSALPARSGWMHRGAVCRTRSAAVNPAFCSRYEMGTSLAIVAEAVVEAVVHGVPRESDRSRSGGRQVPAELLGERCCGPRLCTRGARLAPGRLTCSFGPALRTTPLDPSSLVERGVRSPHDLGAETTALRGLSPWAHEVLAGGELSRSLGELRSSHRRAAASVDQLSSR